MNKRIKVLYYNWVPFDNKYGLGGGVSIYIKNIIGEMIKHDEYSVYFLSSGYLYNPLKKTSYIERYPNIYGKKCKSFQIINSAVIGPMGNLAWNISKYTEDTATFNLLVDFIKHNGPFDIIHIFNIGGFAQKVLTLKETFPNIKFVFDIHNYNFACMNSYLFNHKEECLCENFKNGNFCLECYSNIKISENLYKERVKRFWESHFWEKILYKIQNKFKNNFEKDYKNYLSCQYQENTSTAHDFKIYRENNVLYLNKYFDRIIAVSKRVKKIAVSYGINENKIVVSYIGTKFADKQQEPRSINCNTNLKIAYLGYANVLKGYYFLIDTLSKMSPEIANKIEIVLAAKNAKLEKIQKKLNHFSSVKIYDGYSHNNLDAILEGVDLGIVPVLWEDNLPQVAIEIVSLGIPILTRNLGGASELAGSCKFIFKNEKELISKLKEFSNNKNLLLEYWNYHDGLTTMKQNFITINNIYMKLLEEQ